MWGMSTGLCSNIAHGRLRRNVHTNFSGVGRRLALWDKDFEMYDIEEKGLSRDNFLLQIRSMKHSLIGHGLINHDIQTKTSVTMESEVY